VGQHAPPGKRRVLGNQAHAHPEPRRRPAASARTRWLGSPHRVGMRAEGPIGVGAPPRCLPPGPSPPRSFPPQPGPGRALLRTFAEQQRPACRAAHLRCRLNDLS
jgi:hypothetical protein